MAKDNFVHLHSHTQYSLLDGANKIESLIEKAEHYGMPAVAITDHGNMFGAIDFYLKTTEVGIKPIIGCEVYIAPKSRFNKKGSTISEASYHLTLLAQDEKGYHNLMRLSSIGYQEGFYYRPRIDKESLSQYGEGIIGLSGCLKGEINQLLLDGRSEEALNASAQYRDILGEGNFYIELQDHGIDEQRRNNPQLVEIAKKLDLPLVATNDCHYLTREDRKAHDTMLCIQTGTTLDNPSKLRFSSEEFYFKSPEEMWELFKDHPDALHNTLSIAEKCDLKLELGVSHFPHFETPDGSSLEDYLTKICNDNLHQRYPRPTPEITQRLEYELGVITNMGYAGYFLIVWDFINYAKGVKIPIGIRGSGVASLVVYLLGLSDIDPIKYNLSFERLLNPERVSLPDLDVDICFERRGEVIEYVTKKYGKDHVAQIITFGTMAAKACLRDVGRVMNMPYNDVDKIAKLVPFGPKVTLSASLENVKDMSSLYETDPKAKELIDTARTLEGLNRHASTHAAGVVISQEPLLDYVPLYKASGSDETITQYHMDAVEEVGLIKFDFLGLKTLTMIKKSVDLIQEKGGEEIDLSSIPLDDEKAYKMLSAGRTAGVFQFEGAGVRDLIRKLKPSEFEDLIALNALNRPGPLGSGMVDDFIDRRHGRGEIKYMHPRLEPIMKETYGICLFQEQVMRIANELAGFSMGQADILRRAMGKKKPEEMAKQRGDFTKGAVERGIKEDKANEIFDMMDYFSGYGFNRSHCTQYAMISYQTSYLKANYPLEFMAALMTVEAGNTDKVAIYISECQEMGIEVLRPDVNGSESSFRVEQGAIRFGLAAIKNVGISAVESIVRDRKENGPFTSIFQLCENVDLRLVNKRVLESLVKAGALDSMGGHRAQLTAAVDNALAMATSHQKDRVAGQISLFGSGDASYQSSPHHKLQEVEVWSESNLLNYENEVLGMYLSGHPLDGYKKEMKDNSTVSTKELANLGSGSPVSLAGMITEKKEYTDKKGDLMAFVTIEDLEGSAEITVFSSVYDRGVTGKNSVCLIKGTIDNQNGSSKVLASEIIPLSQAGNGKGTVNRAPERVCIETTASELEARMDDLKNILESTKGEVPVYIHVALPEEEGRKVIIEVGPPFYVNPSDQLSDEVELLFGKDSVDLVVGERTRNHIYSHE